MASGFVKIAMDEFYSHNPNNLTGLVQRYWTMVEDDVAGKHKQNYIYSLFLWHFPFARILIARDGLIFFSNGSSLIDVECFSTRSDSFVCACWRCISNDTAGCINFNRLHYKQVHLSKYIEIAATLGAHARLSSSN